MDDGLHVGHYASHTTDKRPLIIGAGTNICGQCGRMARLCRCADKLRIERLELEIADLKKSQLQVIRPPFTPDNLPKEGDVCMVMHKTRGLVGCDYVGRENRSGVLHFSDGFRFSPDTVQWIAILPAELF